jgi:hypothetical protein
MWAADFRVSSAFDAEGLVVEGQFADELTGGVVENADVWVVDEDDDVVTAAHAWIGRCGVGSCCSHGVMASAASVRSWHGFHWASW